MKVITGISGWLCLSALLSGLRTGEALDSIARCSLTLSASATSQSVQLAAKAVAEATAYVCGQGTVAAASAHAVAEATARAAAEAVARATADCYSQGNSSFKVNGRSLAEAHAYAYAEAFAAGAVKASVCNKCSASAEFLAKSWSELFLTAVAEAQFDLEGSGNAAINADIFVKSVAEAVVTAYAEVLVDAKAAFDKGCDGSILGVVITGDVNNPNVADCFITVRGEDDSFALDAAADASIVITDFLCGGANKQVDAVAEATAKAVARAIAEVTLDCIIEGNAFACALGDADVRTVAVATATAIAEAVVNLKLTHPNCQCELSLDAITEATETIVAEAAASAWAGTCSGKTFLVESLAVSIQSKIAKAYASIWTTIRDGGCTLDVDIVSGVTVKTCTTCAVNNRLCYSGNAADVKGCCDSKMSCIRRTSRTGFCRDPNNVPSTWAGGKIDCT